MEAAQIEKIEREIIGIVKKICESLNIDEVVDGNFCPGNYIRSHVLVSIIPEIEIKVGVIIPLQCYIFNDNNTALSIKSAVNKLLKETKKVKKQQKQKV